MEEIKKEHIDEGRSVAWLSYLSILLVIPLVLQKDNPYTKFHVKQGLVLLILEIILSVVSKLLVFIPFLGPFLASLIIPLAWIFVLVLIIMGIINALQGKTQRLPLIGAFGEKFTF